MSIRTEILSKGCYRARFADQSKDLAAAQALRTLCFGTNQPDLDRFDDVCSHVLIEDIRSDRLVCAFRVLQLPNGTGITQSYSAQYYDLSALAHFPGPMAEMGRFCKHPDCNDPDILRLAWGALTRIVDDHGIQMLFGCSSFAGTETEPHLDTFAALKHRYQAPERWRPKVKAPNVVKFDRPLAQLPEVKQAMLGLPPLLRSYLMMGGWVSDHAVVDTAMNTLHVFTGLEIGAIPKSRKRLLRVVAGDS
ncbi:MAG: ornithine-acyl-ACP acyltransferase [Rhodobacteraceae bacterium]|nr:MAG: ornithine-acyl-ACP acyltransferase [Paracoccaceae bacterium]